MPSWQEGCGQGTAATATALAAVSSQIPDTAGGSGQQMLCAPRTGLGVPKGGKGNVVLARLVLGVGFGYMVGELRLWVCSLLMWTSQPYTLVSAAGAVQQGKSIIFPHKVEGQALICPLWWPGIGPGTVLCEVRS